jgi:hypothetical protein
MSVILQSSSGGSVTLNEPTTTSNFTQTLPSASGTVMVSGNMPAFSAYQSTLQSISASTFTKIQFQTEEFDTASAFDKDTNYRFTPQVAGYYQVNSAVALGAGTTGIVLVSIYKNGTEFKRGNIIVNSVSAATPVVSALIYLNGSTDYIETWLFQSSGTAINTAALLSQTYFQAVMVRAA